LCAPEFNRRQYVANGSTSEVKLIESLLEQRVHPRLPRRLIYDRAAD